MRTLQSNHSGYDTVVNKLLSLQITKQDGCHRGNKSVDTDCVHVSLILFSSRAC